MTKLSTPYYLSGRQARSWHTNKAENAAIWAVGAGALAGAAHHSHTRGLAQSVARSKGYHVETHHMNAFGGAVAGAAIGVAAYGGYHAYRAHRINQGLKQRKKKGGK